jgi:hypothetical protein
MLTPHRGLEFDAMVLVLRVPRGTRLEEEVVLT